MSKRYIARLNHDWGAYVVDTKRDVEIAWCSNAVSASAKRVVSIRGLVEARRIARALNAAEGRKR